MAQIRSKQIADFLSTVNWSNVTSAQIANASDIKALVSTEIAAVNGDNSALAGDLAQEILDRASADAALSLELSTEIYDARQYTSDEMLRAQEAEGVINESIDSLEVALAAEINATNSDVTRIDANVSTEKARIDAILLASDADKDSFAEIVSVINAVDLTNDNALAAVILDLNAEISATNSDFVRVEANLSAEIAATNDDVAGINNSIDSLELALSAEISATDADVTALEGKISTEKGRAESAELVLTNDLATLSTEVVDEVASIDARLGSVSGNLVDSVDSLETALTAEISATNADFVSVEGKIEDEISRAEAAELVLTNDLADEVARAKSIEALLSAEIVKEHNEHLSTEVVLDGKITTEKGRIDAILLASAADKDSFAEIVSLINQVDTTNDNAFAAYSLATNASIDSLETALTAEINSTNSDITRLEGELAAEVTSLEGFINDEVTSLEGFINTEVTSLENLIDTEVTSLETAHDARLTSLEGYIMEDAEMAVESFTGNGFGYRLTKAVQDDNKFLVSAFVNGHKVEVASVSGMDVTLANPHYDIDADDVVVITYQY